MFLLMLASQRLVLELEKRARTSNLLIVHGLYASEHVPYSC